MEKVKRKSVGNNLSMCVQPSFVVGTSNEDGTYNFAPITWVSVTNDKDSKYILVVSMFGTKTTKHNVIRTGLLSVNLVSSNMLRLMDYLGTRHGMDGKKDGIPYGVSNGEVIDVPVLDSSRWVYECRVIKSVDTGAATTFFCQIENIQIDEQLENMDAFGIDLAKLDPVIYTGMYNGIGNYYSIGNQLGKIGDFDQAK